MPRAVLRKGRRREGGRLIRQPLGTVQQPGTSIRPTPGTDLLPRKGVADGRDWPNRIEGPLVIPAADTGVKDRVREAEEELDVGLHPVPVGTVMVTPRDKLSEEVPVSGRQFGMRPVCPVFGDHLLLVGKSRAEGEQGTSLRLKGARSEPGRPARGSQLGDAA